MAETNLKEKTAKGLFWGGVSSGGQQVLNLVFGIFLARILSVSDYGLVGMLAVFSQVASALQESGFIAALNRKKEATQADYNAVFWFNVLCGLALYVILFFCAPLIAAWFREPVLVPLSRVVFLSFVFSCFGTTPRAYLFRHMRVKETAWTTLAAIIISGVTGLVLALCGFAYWGLAVQTVTYCLCITVGSWVFSGWRPSLRIDLRPLRGMVGFASKLLVTNVFTIVNNNLFSLFLGRLYDKQMVGYYNSANKWTTTGHSTLTGMLYGVTQPLFARMDEPAQTCRAFQKILRFTAFVACPCMFGLALIAPEFITITITAKWLPAARLMQILCIGGAFVPVASVYSHFLISRGKSDVFMYCTIVLCILQTASLYVFHPLGVEAMVTAYVALNLMWLPVWHTFLRRLLGLSFLRALRDMLPFAAVAAGAVVVAWVAALPFDNVYLTLAVKVLVAALVYVGTLKVLNAVILDECLSYLLKGRKK